MNPETTRPEAPSTPTSPTGPTERKVRTGPKAYGRLRRINKNRIGLLKNKLKILQTKLAKNPEHEHASLMRGEFIALSWAVRLVEQILEVGEELKRKPTRDDLDLREEFEDVDEED